MRTVNPELRKRRIISLAVLLFVLAIMASIFYIYTNNPGLINRLSAYGYLGAFLISLILNATIVLPAGSAVVLAILGATLPSATLVGIAGGAGAALGEITGYLAGRSGQEIIHRGQLYTRVSEWMKRWGVVVVFVFSIVPFFFDVVGLTAGVLRMPFWKFLIACWLGRTILYIGIAFAGAQGWEFLLRYFT